MCVCGGGDERVRETESKKTGKEGGGGEQGEGGRMEGDKSHLEDTKKWSNEKNLYR